MCRTGGRRCPNAGGRSTQTTRQAVHRARRAVQAARLTGDPAAIDAARERLDAAQDAHLEALEAAHHHDHHDETTGHLGDVTPVRVPRPPAGQPTARWLGNGAVADVELLTYPDGTRLVRKRHGAEVEEIGADPVELTDAEDLAPHVMNALGMRYAAVHRTAPTEVLMEYVEGRIGAEVMGGHRRSDLSDADRDSDEGRRLGLADHIIGNRDRNAENWFQTPDGRLVGIDHGMSFDTNRFSTSPFALPLYDRSDPVFPKLRPNGFTKTDMDVVGQRLAALRPEFEKRGRADWHDSMMRRHRELADHATGTTDLIDRQRPTDAHTHGKSEDTVSHHETPDQSVDVTDSRPTDRRDRRDRQPRFTVVNTNIAAPGAHVGSQHDVVGHPAATHSRNDFPGGPIAGDGRDVTDHVNEALRRAAEAVRSARLDRDQDDTTGDRDDWRGTRNVASGDDHVDVQIGIQIGRIHRRRS